LNKEEINEFINYHLPYRIKILENVISHPNKFNTDKYWPSVYESAQIICRMFIQFFGLGVDSNFPPKLKELQKYYSKNDTSFEVKIKDLGFDFIRLSDLTEYEREILAHAYESGSRATAHLTYGSPFSSEPQKVLEASNIIRRLLKNKLNI
jgi:hypothetical protein